MFLFDRKRLYHFADYLFSNENGFFKKQIRIITYLWLIPGLIYFFFDFGGRKTPAWADFCEPGFTLVQDYDKWYGVIEHRSLRDYIPQIQERARIYSYPNCFNEMELIKDFEKKCVFTDRYGKRVFEESCFLKRIDTSYGWIYYKSNWVSDFFEKVFILLACSYPSYLFFSIIYWAFKKKKVSEETKIKDLEQEIEILEKQIKLKNLEAKKEELKKEIGK